MSKQVSSHSKKSKTPKPKTIKHGIDLRTEKRISSDDRHLVIPNGSEYSLLLDVVNTSKKGLLVHAATPIKVKHKILVIRRYRGKFSVRNIRKQEPLAVYTVRWCTQVSDLGYFWGMELTD